MGIDVFKKENDGGVAGGVVQWMVSEKATN